VNPNGRNSGLAAYQRVAAHGGVSDADPHALVLMLMDTILERLNLARSCIEHGELARKAKFLHSCVTMVAELRGSLNLEQGGSLAQNLSNLYEYMARRLLLANVSSDVKPIKEVIDLMSEIRGAWAAIGPSVRQAAPPPAKSP
jgi:flagellar secretion chaperone FliS